MLERHWQGTKCALKGNPVSVPLRTTQIPHWLAWDRTRPSVAKYRHLTGWAHESVVFYKRLNRVLWDGWRKSRKTPTTVTASCYKFNQQREWRFLPRPRRGFCVSRLLWATLVWFQLGPWGEVTLLHLRKWPGYGPDGTGIELPLLTTERLPSQNIPDQPWDQPSFRFNVYRGLISERGKPVEARSWPLTST
jgi:hypothetical protein